MKNGLFSVDNKCGMSRDIRIISEIPIYHIPIFAYFALFLMGFFFASLFLASIPLLFVKNIPLSHQNEIYKTLVFPHQCEKIAHPCSHQFASYAKKRRTLCTVGTVLVDTSFHIIHVLHVCRVFFFENTVYSKYLK